MPLRGQPFGRDCCRSRPNVAAVAARPLIDDRALARRDTPSTCAVNRAAQQNADLFGSTHLPMHVQSVSICVGLAVLASACSRQSAKASPTGIDGIFGDSLIVAIKPTDEIAPFIVQVRTNRHRADSASFRRYASSELERIGYHLSDSWTHRKQMPILVVPCYVDACVPQSELNDYPLDRGLLYEKSDTLGALNSREDR